MYNELNEHKLIILTQLPEISSGLSFELKKFIEEGGSLLIFPSENININSYNNFLKSIGVNTIEKLETGINPIGNINPNHPLFKGVFQKVPKNLDLPTAKKSFLMTRYAKTGEEQLMQYKNGNSFISTYKIVLLPLIRNPVISRLIRFLHHLYTRLRSQQALFHFTAIL